MLSWCSICISSFTMCAPPSNHEVLITTPMIMVLWVVSVVCYKLVCYWKSITRWHCCVPDMIAVVALVVTKFLLDCVPITGLSLARGTAGFLLSLSGYLKSFSMAIHVTLQATIYLWHYILSGSVVSFFFKKPSPGPAFTFAGPYCSTWHSKPSLLISWPWFLREISFALVRSVPSCWT